MSFTNTTKIATTAYIQKNINSLSYEKKENLVWWSRYPYINHNALQLTEIQRLIETYDARVTIENTSDPDVEQFNRVIIRFENEAEEALFILKENH